MSSLERYTQILNSEVSPRDNLYSLMETIKLLMIHTARVNMDKSVAGSITQSIANSIPILTPKYGASSHETHEERREREKHELSVRQAHQKLFSQIEIVMLRQGQRIHDLRDSFNVIIKGILRDEAEEKDFDEFNVIADWPIKINIFDLTKTLLRQKKES